MHSKFELLLVKCMRVLPIDWTSAIGGVMGKQEVLRAQKKKRKWVFSFFKNIEVLTGITDPKTQQQRLMQFGEEFGRLYAETTILQKIDKAGNIHLKGLQNLEQATTPKIFIAPHLSNWELIFKVFTLLDNKTYVLYEPRENTQRMQIVNAARLAWDKKISLISTAEPMAMKKLKQALNNGANIFILPDEEVNGMVKAPSLGRQIPYAGNRWIVSRLAAYHQVDIIPISVKRLIKVRFEVTIHKKLSSNPSLDAKQNPLYLADEIDHLFNTLISEAPHNWYWLPYLNLQSDPKS